jgi:hypothetical protein
MASLGWFAVEQNSSHMVLYGPCSSGTGRTLMVGYTLFHTHHTQSHNKTLFTVSNIIYCMNTTL